MDDASPAIRDISLRQLHAFLSVVETGSFTAAAATLHLTQSAVSVLIRELESHLGLRLFDRTTRSVQLTEAGREFAAGARRAVGELQAVVRHSRDVAAKNRGVVRVAASPLLSSFILPRWIRDYRARYPGIAVVLRDAPAVSIHALVEEAEVDVGFGPPTGPQDPVRAERLAFDELAVVCPRGHELARRKTVGWREVLQHPVIALGPDSGTRRLAEASVAAAGLRLQPTYEVSFIWTAVGMVEAGLGVAVTSGLVRALAATFDVEVRHIGRAAAKRELCLLVHRRRSLSPAAESFCSFARDRVAASGLL